MTAVPIETLPPTLGGGNRSAPGWMRWAGLALSAAPALMLLGSAVMKLIHNRMIVEKLQQQFGYSESLLTPIGIVELLCVVVYLIPRTSVLGAILMTGYFGGAVATHVRVSDPFVVPLALGVFAWGGLFLRDARLRELLPLKRSFARS
jgi:hypothetical protein